MKNNSARPKLFRVHFAAVILLCSAIAIHAQTNFQRLKSFGVPTTSGIKPISELLAGTDGMLYGVTYSGGSNNVGIVYSVAKNGANFSALHHFTGGMFPAGGLVQGSDGILYGTTQTGGSNNCGTIYSLRTNGVGFKILHDFNSKNSEGVFPCGSLLLAADGGLYGITSSGGSNNCGTVFRFGSGDGDYKILHQFVGTDGSNPFASLRLGKNGMLYGTTQNGGSNDCGTIFQLDTNGENYFVLHHFAGGDNDGRMPLGSVAVGTNNALYGVTYYGGTNDSGTIFEADTNGNYQLLHCFNGSSDGNHPWAGLTSATEGTFYGTTRFGGSNDMGTIFRLDITTSHYVLLHQFCGRDGNQPQANLLFASDETLFGTTTFGGDGSLGVIFKLFSGPANIKISNARRRSDGIFLEFDGGSFGQNFVIEATTNLDSPDEWQSLGVMSADADGTFQFLDTQASNFPARFYRCQMP
ncbi:MAG TPA: choice-of-anchor tandem repeat GloVer-containing protein [Verrucomicrobiae bacterium]|nr:choice-of-anchor tandem repeat GloVer-containing protein [Verrucomicrobiae bacterium]